MYGRRNGRNAPPKVGQVRAVGPIESVRRERRTDCHLNGKESKQGIGTMNMKNTESRQVQDMPVFVPVHMKGADEIAAVFGVSRNTVSRWVQKGAPIRRIGKKYQAQYAQLWDWLVDNSSR